MTESERELREQLVTYARQMRASGLVRGTSGNVSARPPGSSWCLITPSGVDYETGLDAVEELRALVPEGASLTQLALRWILDHPAVSTVIPGAKTSDQAHANAAASELAPLSESTQAAIATLYREQIAPHVHYRW